jgi:hypothetical protein
MPPQIPTGGISPGEFDPMIRQVIRERLTQTGLSPEYQALMDIIREEQARTTEQQQRRTLGTLAARGLATSPISEYPLERIREDERRTLARSMAELGTQQIGTRTQALGAAMDWEGFMRRLEQDRIQREKELAFLEAQTRGPQFTGDLGFLGEAIYNIGQVALPFAAMGVNPLGWLGKAGGGIGGLFRRKPRGSTLPPKLSVPGYPVGQYSGSRRMAGAFQDNLMQGVY